MRVNLRFHAAHEDEVYSYEVSCVGVCRRQRHLTMRPIVGALQLHLYIFIPHGAGPQARWALSGAGCAAPNRKD
jgi:hypothetical protein